MIQNLNDEKLFKLVEEHFGVTYFAKNDAILHNETGDYNPAYLYRDFVQAVIDVALKDLALNAHAAIAKAEGRADSGQAAH